MKSRTLRDWVLDFIAIVVLPGAAILLIGSAVAEQLSWRDLERTNATITENVVRRGSEGVVTCTITYSFTDGSGREYRGRGRTHGPSCANNPAGNFVAVEYVRTDPGHSRILGENSSDILFGALFVLAILWPLVGPGRWNRSAGERVRSNRGHEEVTDGDRD